MTITNVTDILIQKNTKSVIFTQHLHPAVQIATQRAWEGEGLETYLHSHEMVLTNLVVLLRKRVKYNKR